MKDQESIRKEAGTSLDNFLGQGSVDIQMLSTYLLDLFAVPFSEEETAVLIRHGFETTSDKAHLTNDGDTVVKVQLPNEKSARIFRADQDYMIESFDDLDFLDEFYEITEEDDEITEEDDDEE
jgi:hypothetical protein